MHTFTATGWFEVLGHGCAASIAGIEGLDPLALTGQQVEIDGKVYTVKGVETGLLFDNTGDPFVLLVGER